MPTPCPSCAGRGYTIGPPDSRGVPVLARCPEPHAGCLCTGASDAICELPDGRLGDCPVCGPALARMRRATDSLRAAGVPVQFRSILPAGLAGDERRKLADGIVERAIADFGDPACACMSGSIFRGLPGRGKSECAAAILNELVIRTGQTARWISIEDLFARLRNLMDSRGERDRGTEAKIVRPVVTSRIAVLDDLAVGKLSDHEAKILYLIVNGRHELRAKHLTIVTTNATERLLATLAGGRLWSRIAEMCVVAEFLGPDHRKPRGTRRPVGADPEPAA